MRYIEPNTCTSASLSAAEASAEVVLVHLFGLSRAGSRTEGALKQQELLPCSDVDALNASCIVVVHLQPLHHASTGVSDDVDREVQTYA